MIKVAKFGGSSLSNGEQFAKVKNIIDRDPDRRMVVVSAPGRRSAEDNKVTDLLYLVKAHIKYDVSYDSIFEIIEQRYMDIRSECHLTLDLDREFEIIRDKLDKQISAINLSMRLISSASSTTAKWIWTRPRRISRRYSRYTTEL